MQAFWEALIHTPWWVYLILAYLIYIGILASKTRTVSLKKLIIVPALFTYLSIHTLLTSFQVNIFSIGVWSAAIIIGSLLGFWQIYRLNLKIDKKKQQIQIPGSWMTLILFILIFATKYYFGYQLAVDPSLSKTTWFEFSLLAVSGVLTGLFIGRLICYFYRFFTYAHTDL